MTVECYENPRELMGAGPRAEAQCAEPLVKEHIHSRGNQNRINRAFADLLLGIRIGDEPRQRDAWKLLKRFAWSAAVKSGFVRNSRFGDYEQVALDCLLKEVQKNAELEAYEIVQNENAKKFAYIWKALTADYIDEMRSVGRRREQPVDWDSWTSWELIANKAERDSAPDPTIGKMEEQWDQNSLAWQLEKAANDLPLGPSAISETLAELFRDSELLQEFADLRLSDTECKSRFVEYVARRRKVGDQVVRRDLKRFKDNRYRPEYCQTLEILRGNTILPSKRPPRITAPAAPRPQPCPLPAEIQVQPIWATGDQNSNFWSSRCPVCDARLHSEDVCCSVCHPEDSGNKFQTYCWVTDTACHRKLYPK